MLPLLQNIPPLDGSLRIWTEKVACMCPRQLQTNAYFINAVRALLPDSVFEALPDKHFDSLSELFAAVGATDPPGAFVLRQRVFHQHERLPNELPSATYRRFRGDMKLLFPSLPSETLDLLATAKFFSVLPMVLKLPLQLRGLKTMDFEALGALDEAYSSADFAAVAAQFSVQPQERDSDPKQPGDAVTAPGQCDSDTSQECSASGSLQLRPSRETRPVSRKRKFARSRGRNWRRGCGAVFSLPIAFADSCHEALIDTGSDLTLVPNCFLPQGTLIEADKQPVLRTINGLPIKTFGWADLSLTLLGVKRSWRCLVADVSRVTIGSDFLAAHKLLVDCEEKTILPKAACAVVALQNAPVSLAASSLPNVVGESAKVVQADDDFFGEIHFDQRAPHPIEHFIRTDDKITSMRPHRLSAPKLEIARKMIDDMLEQGLIRESHSPFAAPIVLVPKKNGEMRMCVDYRALNEHTLPDAFPIPNIQDALAAVSGKIFSSLDLKTGFHQIPVHPADVAKTAFATPFGLFEWLRMPFGLKNAPATMQRFLTFVLKDIANVIVYMDDILVWAENETEHNHTLSVVLDRLRKHGLRLNREKCVFAQPRVTFLGFELSGAGYQPITSRVQAIAEAPVPKSKKEVQRFIGMMNFYRQHIPSFATTLSPLYEAVKSFQWSEAQQTAFVKAKESLIAHTTLSPPNHAAPFHIFTDASGVAVGATVLQNQRPILFFSSKLKGAQNNYSAYDKKSSSPSPRF